MPWLDNLMLLSNAWAKPMEGSKSTNSTLTGANAGPKMHFPSR